MIARNLLNSLKIRNRFQLQTISRSACGKQFVFIYIFWIIQDIIYFLFWHSYTVYVTV